jgi:hypothetical protein
MQSWKIKVIQSWTVYVDLKIKCIISIFTDDLTAVKMKPRSAIDEWIRQSFPECTAISDLTNRIKGRGNVTGNSTNEIIGRSHSTKSRTKSREEHVTDSRESISKTKGHKSKRCVDKLVERISKLNNILGADVNYKYVPSDVSSVTRYETSNWSQSPMGESSFYNNRKHGSPITISSGYESDFLPTCEEDIDNLLHSERVDIIQQNNALKDTHESGLEISGVVPTNFRAWPGRRDLVCQQRLDRHNHKLTKVKKSMHGIIKDLKETDPFEVNRTRRSRSFDVSTRKNTDDSREQKHRKSFSEGRRVKIQNDGYFVMDCYHGQHWDENRLGFKSPTGCADCMDCADRVVCCAGHWDGCTCDLADGITKEPAKDWRERKQKRHKHRQKRHSEHQCGDEKQWRYLVDDCITVPCDSKDTTPNSRDITFVGAPLLTSSPRFGNSKIQDYEDEHIYETIPGDDFSVDLAAKTADIPPELPARNYKKIDTDDIAHARQKSQGEEAFHATPSDLNNNHVSKFWDRLDGVSRDPRDRSNKQTTLLLSDTVASGRVRRSPLSSRTQREVRKVETIPIMVTSAKPDKNRKREELDISKLKKKAHTFHDYTVADVLDSICRFESDEPDLIQNIPRPGDHRFGYKMEDMFYGVRERCGQKVAPQALWSNNILVGRETII